MTQCYCVAQGGLALVTFLPWPPKPGSQVEYLAWHSVISILIHLLVIVYNRFPIKHVGEGTEEIAQQVRGLAV